jgi:hypothetical protein
MWRGDDGVRSTEQTVSHAGWTGETTSVLIDFKHHRIAMHEEPFDVNILGLNRYDLSSSSLGSCFRTASPHSNPL